MLYSNYDYIAAIAKHRSISKAAAELFISQPYLSKILSNLEEQYRTPFFDRSSYPITLTDAGKCYLSYARKFRSLEKELEGMIEDISTGTAGVLTIGTPLNTGSYFLPYVLPIYTKKFPHVSIRIIEKNSDTLVRLLQEGKISICILSRSSFPLNISYEYIMDENIYLAVPPDHVFMKYCGQTGTISILDEELIPLLDQEPFILLPENLNTGYMTREYLQTHHVNPNIILTTESVQTAYRLTAQNMGFSFVTNQSLKSVWFKRQPGLLQLGKLGLNRAVVAACQKGAYLPRYAQAFIQCLKTLGRLQKEHLIDGDYGIPTETLEEIYHTNP